MSLQAKIKQELDDLAVRILRKVNTESNDDKLVKLTNSWFELKRLLEKLQKLEAEELEKQ